MAKSLIKNSIANVFYKSLNILFPLITATYVSRVLTVSGVGRVSYAQNIVSYFVMFAALGMPSYGTREIAKLKKNNKNKNGLFSELFLINAISTILFSIAYLILINTVPMFFEQIKLYYAVGLTLILNIFNIDWFYQGEEEYGYIAVRSFIVKLISVICIFIFVKTYNDYVAYALITALGTVGNNIINIFHLRKKVKFTYKNINLRKHMKSLLLLISSAIAIELYTAMDTTMIGILCTEVEVGYYANALKLVKIIQMVISAIGAILMPRLSFYYAEGMINEYNKLINKALKNMQLIAIPAMVGVVWLADYIVPFLFGETFYGSISTLKLLSLALPILVLNVLYGIQGLITIGKEKKYLITVCCGAITNLILNPILIHFYKNDGAAIATLICESVVAITTIVFIKKYIRIEIEKKYILTMAISVFVMSAYVYIIKKININFQIKLIMSIIGGIIVYILSLLKTKNETAQEIVEILHNKIKNRCNKLK